MQGVAYLMRSKGRTFCTHIAGNTVSKRRLVCGDPGRRYC